MGDSVHAFAWWTLSKGETVAVINEQKSRSSKRPAPQIGEPPPASKRTSVPKGSVAKTPTTSPKTGADPPPSKETVKAKTAAITAPIVAMGTDLVIPLPELTGPPGPQQSPPIEYRGNAGIREASQVRGKRTSKGHAPRIPHTAEGTPSIPPEEAVGAYRSDSPARSIVAQSQDRRAHMRGSSDDRSRSRDPPRESTPVVPIAQPQVVMHVPNNMLPIMASAGVGHLALDQPVIPTMSGVPPPKASEPSIHEFFESFTQAQARDEQVRAIQQFTAELLSAPPKSGSPVSQKKPDTSRPASEGGASERISSPPPPADTAAAASTESSSPKEDVGKAASESVPTERGRQPSITKRVSSSLYWPSLRSITGSSRRPRSPTMPPRPKPESAPKRAASMPRLADPAPAESTSDIALSAAANPITIVPAVQIPAPVAVESRAEPPAPEVTSDAETLALPGLPGATGDENVPSPVEEEVERTMDDPYVSAGEGLASGESAPVETALEAAPTEHTTGVTSSTSEGFGGLVPVIPIPTVSEVMETTAKRVVKPTETASKETKEATPSEPSHPAAQPTEAESSKPPSGEAESSKPPSGEAEASQPATGEAKAR